MAKKQSTPCPCGSGLAYDDCCGPYLDAAWRAPTAEALMRSRYSAYARGDAAYLSRTWHASTRPPNLDLGAEQGTRWLGLRIVATQAGGLHDDQGTVEFIARYRSGGARAGRMHERSRFKREAGEWFYLDGEQL